MAAFVLDASWVPGFFFRDEISDAARRIRDRALTEDVIVPAIWPLEVANILRQGERRKRISEDDARTAAILVMSLRTFIEAPRLGTALGPVLDLARRHMLTAYDASYLELALRLGLPLATRDEDLLRACAAEGVPIA
jgi:predicted nucleic acid-binding protein